MGVVLQTNYKKTSFYYVSTYEIFETCFVGNFEFYYDDITVMSFVNVKYRDSVILFVFCGQKDRAQIFSWSRRCC